VSAAALVMLRSRGIRVQVLGRPTEDKPNHGSHP
jgi:hypothetical protein